MRIYHVPQKQVQLVGQQASELCAHRPLCRHRHSSPSPYPCHSYPYPCPCVAYSCVVLSPLNPHPSIPLQALPLLRPVRVCVVGLQTGQLEQRPPAPRCAPLHALSTVCGVVVIVFCVLNLFR